MANKLLNLQTAITTIIEEYHQFCSEHSFLIGLSGIDGSGKGYLAKKMATALKNDHINAVVINADGWLNLPHIRFLQDNLAENFYLNGFRFHEMFEQLILPLRNEGSIQLTANFTEETATNYREHFYDYHNVDVIILEGIYLLQSSFIDYYNLSFWVDCTFTTALERALARGQENLPHQETIKAYQTIYFPAQMIHFQRDNPKKLASGIINNDPRINPDFTYPQLTEINDFNPFSHLSCNKLLKT